MSLLMMWWTAPWARELTKLGDEVPRQTSRIPSLIAHADLAVFLRVESEGGFAAQIQLCSLTGSYVMATAEHREPYESRGSRTVLGARGGEIPPRDST
jgi:hypothetical protein